MPALASVAQSVRRVVGLDRSKRGKVEFSIVPASLRSIDPAFGIELADGQFGLEAGVLRFGARNPFDGVGASDTLLRELYGFSWLRHMEAARTADAEAAALRLLLAWPRSQAARSAIAQEPAVLARRALSLLAHADAGLAIAKPAEYDAIMDLVVGSFERLERELPRMPLSLARATGAIAIASYAVCCGDPRHQSSAERRLAAELDRQVLPDGGHISRNPAAVLELVLDLLPLRRLYAGVQMPVPACVLGALTRLRSMLTFLQHTDHQLARFNGIGATPQAELATAMLQLQSIGDGGKAVTDGQASASGYIRLDAGSTVILFDSGPQQDNLIGESPFAGAMSFEMSTGRAALFANSGSDAPWLGVARAGCRTTAAHSALVLADAPTSPLTGGRSGVVTAALEPRDGSDAVHAITASSTCYRERFGYVHERRLSLAADGRRLDGRDTLIAAERPGDHAFAVHFHLHPSVLVETEAGSPTLRFTTSDGAVWRLSAIGAVPAIETAQYHGGATGPRETLKVVLAGRTTGTREIVWTVERLGAPV